MLGSIKNLQSKYGIQVKYGQCNDARENVDFEWVSKQENIGIEFEYTTSKFFNSVGAILKSGKFSSFLRCDSWTKATNTVTLIENNLITTNRVWNPFQQFCGKGKQNILSLVQKIGEMCITTH